MILLIHFFPGNEMERWKFGGSLCNYVSSGCILVKLCCFWTGISGMDFSYQILSESKPKCSMYKLVLLRLDMD